MRRRWYATGLRLSCSRMARAFPPSWLIGVESRLLDRIRAAVMVTSLDGTVLYANPYCEVLYGRTPEELGRSLGYTELADMIKAKRTPANGRVPVSALPL